MIILFAALLIELFKIHPIPKAMQLFSKATGLKGEHYYKTIRGLCTGKLHGPPLERHLQLIGKDLLIENITTMAGVIQ